MGAAAPELRGALLGPSPLFVAVEPVLGERPGAAEEENPCPVARSWLPSDGARGGHRVSVAAGSLLGWGGDRHSGESPLGTVPPGQAPEVAPAEWRWEEKQVPAGPRSA